MSTDTTLTENSIASDQSTVSSQKVGVRPAVFVLGRAGGCDLVASVRTHNIYVVDTDAGRVVHRYVFGGDRSLDEFMTAYDSAYGWDERYYGCLSGMVSRAMDE